ncbi:MAG: D-TA family PLP-dependent enzyme [Chitinophagaceae bacterium]|jgi:D-serine deaminase-like pyridoxal phosphate-dependent protein|nr:D-TA family PLP-dependent enzyme [Chitinophagaceae bacterium]
MEKWFQIKNIDTIDTPVLVVYPERVKENIALAIKMVGDAARLRPHVKTHKCKEVSQLLLDAGVTKFKCATIAEAEMLAMTNAPDVLLAYQPVGAKINRLIHLIKNYPNTSFSCITDDKEIALQLNDAARAANICLSVCIDLNVGMNRTGVIPGKAFPLYEQISKSSNLQLKGLHIYDGHIRDTDFSARKAQCDEVYAQIEKLSNEIVNAGNFLPDIIIGGSPTFSIHSKRGGVECSPGTFVYWDYGYAEKFAEQRFLPAALVLSRIISLPNDDIICTDLGHKSIAAENAINNRVHFINAPELGFEAQSEEHLKLKVEKNHAYKIGDVLYGMPYHVCPTIALYEKAITVENGTAQGEWKTVARDRMINV